MRRVALSAVACMIAVLAAAPSPTAAEATTAVAPSLDAPAMASLWRREEGAAAADDAALHPIHVYFDIESDAGRVEAAGACVEAEAMLEGRLACKAEALGPTAAERAAVERWLAPLGRTLTRAEYFEQREKGCFVDWNAAHCRGASVGEAKAVFGRDLAFSRYFKNTRSTSSSKNPSRRAWVLTEGTLDVSGAAPFARVQHVSGLQPYNHKEQRARHMGRHSPSRPQPMPADTSDNPYNTITWWDVDNAKINQWSAPETGTVPLIVHADYDMVYAVILCGDGTPSSSSSYTNSWDTMCFRRNPPLEVTVTVVNPLNQSAIGSALTVDERQCAAANNYNARSNAVICRVYIGSTIAAPVNDGAWASFAFKAHVEFLDGTTAETDRAVNYFFRETYRSGVRDIGGAAITSPVPGPTIIASSWSGVTPAVVERQYRLPAVSATTGAGMVQGVVEFSDLDAPGNGVHTRDVRQYMRDIAQLSSDYDVDAHLEVLGDGSIVDTDETTLDIELVMGLAPGAKSYINCISSGGVGADYATYADALAGFAGSLVGGVRGSFGVSQVWSVSYGGPEWDSTGVDRGLMRQIDFSIAQASDAGVTVTASSGDSGSYFYISDTDDQLDVYLSPNWPASSPNVVAIGATAYRAAQSSSSGGAPLEIACMVRTGNVITSGGGYSTVFQLPEGPQRRASGSAARGMPDVSAIGAWITTVIDGDSATLYGTSASSPIIAAMVTLFNAARNRSGSAPLRQAVGLLYATYENTSAFAFNDVAEGDNCCGELEDGLAFNFASYGGSACYRADPGWDAVTGLGTPDWQSLRASADAWNPPPIRFPGSSNKSSGDAVTITVAVVIAVALVLLGVGAVLWRIVNARRPLVAEAPPEDWEMAGHAAAEAAHERQQQPQQHQSSGVRVTRDAAETSLLADEGGDRTRTAASA